MDIANYLDLRDIFVNELAGSEVLFIFLAIIFIVYYASKFRFSNGLIVITLGVFCIIMSFYFGFLLPLTLAIVGLFFAWQLYKVLRP
jgi:hypothetical protein